MPPVSRARLAIVCPMANERATAADFVCDVLARTGDFEKRRMFVVFDRMCTDDTYALPTDLALVEPSLTILWAPENRSVVDAYVRGYREALAGDYDWILEIDAGYSHRPAEIQRFVAPLESGDWDYIFGSRFCTGGSIGQSSLTRKALS